VGIIARSIDEVIQVVASEVKPMFDEQGIGRFAETRHPLCETLDRPATCESTEHPEQMEFRNGR
jgi:hypothetical protein